MFITKFSIINTENNEEMTDKHQHIWTASGQDLANYQVQIVKNYLMVCWSYLRDFQCFPG